MVLYNIKLSRNTVNRRYSTSHYEDKYGSETFFVAPRLTLSYSRLHASTDSEGNRDPDKVDVYANRYMALAGIAAGFDTSFGAGFNLFAEMGPEVIPSYTVQSEGGDHDEPAVNSWTTFRTGLEMIFPDFKFDNRKDALAWSLGIEMGGINALNPVTREKEWGLEILGGLHFRF